MIPKVGDIWMWRKNNFFTVDLILSEPNTIMLSKTKVICSNDSSIYPIGGIGRCPIIHHPFEWINISSNLSRLLYDV